MNTETAFQLQAIAQNGLLFASSESDQVRYGELLELAIEMTAALGDADVSDVKALFDAAGGYATPKVDVRGAVFAQDKLLLVPSRSHDTWVLPGGWAESDLSPSENVTRHLSSLLGCPVQSERILAVWQEFAEVWGTLSYPTYHIVFQCAAALDSEVPLDVGRLFTSGEIESLPLLVGYRRRLQWLLSVHTLAPHGADFD